VISHFGKKSINKFMKLPLSIGLGPARGLFNTLLKLGFSRNGIMKN